MSARVCSCTLRVRPDSFRFKRIFFWGGLPVGILGYLVKLRNFMSEGTNHGAAMKRTNAPGLASGMAGVVIAFVLSPGAIAGPAKYTGETRSIRVTYTFAEIPSFGMTPDQLQALGRIQKPTKEQEIYIRALIRDASTALYELSDRRAKIDPFDYVDNIKNADLVISLTGDPGRGGWATPGGIEGRPGQVGLYYKVLEKTPQEQSALTVVHELSHYIYALPDEYQDASRGYAR